jgi:hypothetical protein
LFGLLALENGMLTRERLLAAVRAWSADPGGALAGVLQTRGDLGAAQVLELDAAVRRHLAAQSTASGATPPPRKAIPGETPPLEVTGPYADPYAAEGAAGPGPAPVRYRVIRPHAAGGLGEVFLAEDVELRRQVALKEIQARHAGSATSVGRFLREAEITGRLEHPGVVPVYGMGRQPDGRTLASGSSGWHERADTPGEPPPAALKLWEVDTGKELAAWPAGGKGIPHVALAPDGKTVAVTAEADVVLWDVAGRRERGRLQGHDKWVGCVAYHPGGTLLATAGQDLTVRLWDPVSGKPRLTLSGHAKPVHAAAFTRDGKLLATGDEGGEVRLGDPLTGKPLATARGGRQAVYALCFSKDGQTLASGGNDNKVRLWDVARLLADGPAP